ncbi:MAG: ABC transporter substrate-binding protein [Firmicutes bacterium]|nr:ABC transporter substrate-binding protein [Bacillota bacterium]
MKKITSILSIIVLSIVLLSACSSDANNNVLKVGASPVPHGELLNLVKENLKDQGIELEIIEFTDYVKPNLALDEGEIDANFFQHKPYLDNFSNEHDLNLVSVGKIHVEPLGVYSKEFNSIDELKEGSVIAIPNDPTNGGRALILLENEGLIKLKEGAGLNATEKDIIKNPKNLKFKPLESAQLPRALGDVDASVINGNYALEADLIPTDDAILLEGSESPYANIIAVHKSNKDNEKVQALIDALQSEKVKNYILENYDGGVVTAY